MDTRKRSYAVKVFVLFCIITFVVSAEGASAVATVTANIVRSTVVKEDLILSSMKLSMREKESDELTIHNLSSSPRNLQLDLVSVSGGGAECKLRFSPKTISIAPGGYQVVRMMVTRDARNDNVFHHLKISDLQLPGRKLFRIPVEHTC